MFAIWELTNINGETIKIKAKSLSDLPEAFGANEAYGVIKIMKIAEYNEKTGWFTIPSVDK